MFEKNKSAATTSNQLRSAAQPEDAKQVTVQENFTGLILDLCGPVLTMQLT